MILVRLYRFYRMSGLPRRMAFARAWTKTWERI